MSFRNYYTEEALMAGKLKTFIENVMRKEPI
jgi:hypothetical protein